MNKQQVIFNITTGDISGVLTIIKLSGSKSVSLVNKLIKNKINNKLKKKQIFYSKLIYKKKIIDEVILLIYPINNSYDGDENVEIICHANKLIVEQIFTILKIYGASEAQPGDFSKKAFLNNKISLEKLTAINKLINAKTKQDKNFYIETITGKDTPKIIQIQEELKNIISQIEVAFDYPEEANFNKTIIKKKIKNQIIFFNNSKSFYLNNKNNNHLYKISIVGKTNSGKSTLFNKLIGNSKNIVSAKERTTRDSVTAEVQYKKYKIELTDTAGFYHGEENDIDKQAVEKTFFSIEKANLVIFLEATISKSIPTAEKNTLFKKIKKIKKNTIFFINKADLIPTKLWTNNCISALDNKTKNLFKKITPFLKKEAITNKKIIILGNLFQLDHTNKIIKNFKNYLKGLKNNTTQDALIYYLYKNYKQINILRGVDLDIKIIDSIFKNFCLGK